MPYIQKEFSGIFEVTLKEDMVKTVTKLKLPYIHCDLSSIFGKTQNYPYVYVPFWFTVLPLRKDDKVFVRFYQDNHEYPYLWKPLHTFKMDEALFTKYDLPKKKELTEFPSTKDTISSYKFNKDVIFVTSDSYSFFRYKDQILIADEKGFYLNSKSLGILIETLQLEITKKLDAKIDALQAEVKKKLSLKAQELSCGGR